MGERCVKVISLRKAVLRWGKKVGLGVDFKTRSNIRGKEA